MDLASVWRFLHLFFSFAFVGTLVVAEWNGRAARATTDWGQRAVLFRVIPPAAARLAAAASAAAGGGEAAGFEAALARWRLGNVAMSLLYLVLLALMVFRWRS